MYKRNLFTLAFLLLFAALNAQNIWNSDHLSRVKTSLDQPAYAVAYRHLIEEADRIIGLPPLSVMMKEKTPGSGSKHDYMSQARYYWPDPEKPDGLPYIAKDGESNPELEKLDRVRMGQLADRVINLALAWYFSGEERYAQRATELIRVWFFDKDTKMNPNLNYAQVIPGRFNNEGRCYGVIDTYSFVEMLDAVQLLEQSRSFTPKDSRQLKAWFAALTDWILTSKQGKEEANQRNNHAVAHDAQVIAFALYAGKEDVARRVIDEFPERRIFAQIEPDGSQPQELRRTLAFGYSQYNLSHFIDIFLMAQKLGINIDRSVSADGRSFYKAVDFLTPYLGKDVSDWPYRQISEWTSKQKHFADDLYRVWLLDPTRTDYHDLYRRARVATNPADRFRLVYYTPDLTDNAFAFADAQLRCLIKSTEEAKKTTANPRLVSPRTVETDGRLRIVQPRDWTSGFFPAMLWQMYAYTHSDFWHNHAITYTWPIEPMARHTGTHDLGFMVYCPFGNAWQLTGEDSYRRVFLQAARSLSSRYNAKVGAIRSWDHNRDKWQYPVIVDNMLNLELLFRATEETGDPRFRQIAINHANTTLKNHFRPDHSSYHVVNYDTITGNVISRETHQGLFDESVWSRGQAWGLYGYTLCYRFTHDPAYLAQAEAIANFFFTQNNLPADLIPYWDMKDPSIPNAPRDASAAAIIASGLYELALYAGTTRAAQYKAWADIITNNLYEHYQAQPGTEKGFLLLHSTGNYPANDEIDKPIVYADYYYLEALMRRIGIFSYEQ